MTHYLRAESREALLDALVAAGIAIFEDNSGEPELVVRRGYVVDLIGAIYAPTGGTKLVELDGDIESVPIMAPALGFHANILGDLTDEQLKILPVIEEPSTPARQFWS